MLQQVTDFHAEGAELRELLLTLSDRLIGATMRGRDPTFVRNSAT